MRAAINLLAGLILALLIGGGAARTAVAEAPSPLAIVVAKNSPLTNISLYELKHLYLGEFIAGPEGKRLIPLNHPSQSRERIAFDATVLGMTPDQGAAYWIDRRIRGQSGSPRAVDSPELIQRIVSRLDGAVAYVRVDAVRPEMRILRVDGKLPTDADYHLR